MRDILGSILGVFFGGCFYLGGVVVLFSLSRQAQRESVNPVPVKNVRRFYV